MDKSPLKNLLYIVIIILLFSSIFLGYKYIDLNKIIEVKNNLIAELQNTIAQREIEIESIKRDNGQLSEALETEQRRNEDFENQISDISSTVGFLDKLAKTDPELLQKYSKVYFLNEHYTPPRLAGIDEKYVSNPKNLYQIHKDVWPHLENLLEAAADDGIEIIISSAYRSFDEQIALKSSYKVVYGSGANTFSADQGYSEHQLGTTVDFSTTSLGGALAGFSQTEAYKWLQENAHKYGFILSYPENNAYYQFEPWHWRFVGRDLAKELKDENQNFYDWDQRDIDEYLVNIFD